MTDPDIEFVPLGDPTRNEIAERASIIRQSWSPAEFHQRVRTIPHLDLNLPDEQFTLVIECRHSDLEDK